MTTDLENSIRDNAAGPRKAKGDNVEVEQHPLPDQIAADKYLASKNATKRKGLGVSLKKLSPSGAE